MIGKIIVLFIQQSSSAYEKQGTSIYLYPSVFGKSQIIFLYEQLSTIVYRRAMYS
jgi:hypothetical protein